MSNLVFKNYTLCYPSRWDSYHVTNWTPPKPNLKEISLPNIDYVDYRWLGKSQDGNSQEKLTVEIKNFFNTTDNAYTFLRTLNDLTCEYPVIGELYYSTPCRSSSTIYFQYVKIDDITRPEMKPVTNINGLGCWLTCTINFSVTKGNDNAF